MIEAIVEVWCSPLRQEDYSVKIIPLCAGDLFNVEDDIKDYIRWDFYLNTFGVDYLEVKGLWKVVFKISVAYSTVWTYDGPDDDVDIGQEVLFKGQCQEWAEMKYIWLELNDKVENYFKKPWKKHLGLYEEIEMNPLFTEENIRRATFSWEDLHLKTLTIYVDTLFDELNAEKLTCVIAHDNVTHKDYVLYTGTEKVKK